MLSSAAPRRRARLYVHSTMLKLGLLLMPPRLLAAILRAHDSPRAFVGKSWSPSTRMSTGRKFDAKPCFSRSFPWLGEISGDAARLRGSAIRGGGQRRSRASVSADGRAP